ncbi:MAG: SUMF1/EgtB/PvdO family nonheme iron enzyme [Candidatus Contendobacter sp.]|nr:SUMF1/EgtB/PvdO family nonheme iron enzyme [Candidatus Contendobacter sp.]MDG4557398.1 SUMF1/EgtB/PvdO family nonheme iron enzyme [Candidatus Contendobacter sp.]
MANRRKGFLMMVVGLLLAISPPVLAEARYALIIGNGAYSSGPSLPPLNNPVNDAKAVADVLKKLGFEVTLRTNVSKREFFEALQVFQKKLADQSGQTGLVFYSGHGLRGANGNNYLIPVDAKLEFQEQIEWDGVAVERILGDMEAAQAKTSLLIIDACRDIFLKSRSKGSVEPGMQVAQAPEGTLIAFATSPNKRALDYLKEGDRHSPYVTALLEELPKPGRKVEDVLKAVGALVAARTDRLGPDKKQVPSIQSSLFGDFYFVSPASIPPSQPASTPVASAAVPSPFRPTVPDEAPAEGSRPQPGQVFRDTLSDGTRGPALVVIGAGEFWMGSPESEVGREPGEAKERRHRVKIERAFALGQREVTVGEFRRFVEATKYQTEAERDVGAKGCHAWSAEDGKADWRAGLSWRKPGYEQKDSYHPVVCVSWNDANRYAEWLAKQTGQTYRLPTEAEWEYAARAGTTTARYWGEDPDQACRYANVTDQTKGPEGQFWEMKHDCTDGYWYPAPVGSFQPNGWKLYDMLGNVWEWTCSTYEKDYNGAEQRCGVEDTTGPRVLRGGAWNFEPLRLRSAARAWSSPRYWNVDAGFRLARTF